MSTTTRRRASRSRPEKTEAQKAAEKYEQQLKDAGGNVWVNGDLSKKLIYFNNVIRESDERKMDIYYDCKAQKWETGKYAEEFVAILREQIEL